MPYPGLTFAIMVGVALGTAIYYYFNQENANQQRHNTYQYDDRNYNDDYPPNYSWNSSSEPQSSRKRRRNSTSKCSICLDDITNEKIKTISECGHEFHERCITVWFRQNRNCPNCRQPVYT